MAPSRSRQSGHDTDTSMADSEPVKQLAVDPMVSFEHDIALSVHSQEILCINS
jgi:hypothetical protein